MGVVYEGFDPFIERTVAIKTIHHHLLEGELGQDLQQRFRQEVKAAARCSHPGIVTVYDFGEHEGTPFIAMEYIDGRELRDCLEQRGRFPLNDAAAFVLQILEVLEVAHAAGVVHRDIKPSNVLVMADAHVKITDFGVARLDTSNRTQVGAMIGTPSYMTPEQLNGDPADSGSDIYASAVILLELLTGVRPAPGQALLRLQDVTNPATRHTGFQVPELPASLIELLRQALAPRRAERLDSASAMSAALRQVMNGASVQELLEQVSICPPEERVQRSDIPLADGSSFSWAPETLAMVERRLAKHIGPVARMLVRQKARKAPDLRELTQQLAMQIPEESGRATFLKGFKLERTRGGSVNNSRLEQTDSGQSNRTLLELLDSDGLDALESLLAGYLGPMARMWVRKQARKVGSLDELHQRLAEQIPDERERKAFLSKVTKI